ncbi:3-oxoacyl-ACP synthase [Mangrovactinospora gilvigrisea]|uniref:Beta-ketoacyl-[acyl-carrier-protein] synthase III n=1 Tax=Mangrovactinospora gilvigrisea TaxID=1428644 RepID=A0A1J7BGV6_9ACTN|nr:beta-ketoacyl-ACP synthase III [Mangrovactinospora gilvigrisea]OIV37886.1 3-oxoacyl-ACP synthase [Mangrovactinospora gilvigrisea]
MAHAAVVAAVAGHLPPHVVTNHELAQRFDTTEEWIRTRTGIVQRHHVRAGTATSDLAAEAGRRALASAGEDHADVVIVATTTPDRPCPATAPTVASKLGLTGVAAYDIAAVCTGFLYALQAGASAVAAGAARRALVIGAETFSTLLDPSDRTTGVIFGDGAGAVLLRAGARGEAGAIEAVHLGSDGTLADLITVRAGGSEQRAHPDDEAHADPYFRMDGRPVFMAAVRRMTESAHTVLRRTGWAVDDLDHLVGHQANIRILHAVAERLGLPPERALVNLDRVGNTAAASIPLALAHGRRERRLGTGDRVLLTAFGGGATWGAAALTWPDLPDLQHPPAT